MKNPALDRSKIRPSLPLEIDVIEEVDEEESSSGVEASSAGQRQISRKPTSEFALTTQPDEVFVRFEKNRRPMTKNMNFESESSFKTVNMNHQEEDQIGNIISDLDFDKIHVDDTKRRGLHNRNKCFSNDIPANILDTRRSTDEGSQGGGMLSSARSLL